MAPEDTSARAVALAGRSPRDWLASELAVPLGVAAPAGPHPDWLHLDDLDAQRLAGLHALHVRAGAPGPAALKWLVGWFAGGVAAAVGRTLALAGAALVVDPQQVRWRVHPDGWPEGVDLGLPRLVVVSAHPWAGAPGVTVAADRDEVRATALASVLSVGHPLVTRSRGLAKVGPAALWAEVGDRLGLAVALDPTVQVDQGAAEELRAVVRAPAAPWRRRPALDVAPTDVGPAYVGQKGGCCLAYQCATGEDAPCSPGSWEAVLRARFPGRTAYCSTCSLLDGDECRARQRLWFEHHRTEPAHL